MEQGDLGERWGIVVVGGGAAGLMAALWAARRGVRPLLVEGSRDCGLKILVSGGGRCNVLPAEADDSDFFTTGSRHVLRRLFRTWPVGEVRGFFERDLGIPLVLESETGKLFPASEQARPVRDRLVRAVTEAGGEVRTGWRVTGIERDAEGGFRIDGRTAGGERRCVTARRVVLATGGQSLPKTGSDGAGYEMARRLGHSILPPYPALVPLTTADDELRALAGISLPVRWRARKDGRLLEERTRELLFTHRGFSGPAILDASHWVVRDGSELLVAWSGLTETECRARIEAAGRRSCAGALSEWIPRRLAEVLCRRAGIAGDVQLAQLRREERERLLDHLTAFRLPVDGNEGFRTAEVTGGGVPIGEVEPSTLESRTTPALHLCGEILDVVGRIGGYNFHWAWVTGRLAGEAAAGAIAGAASSARIQPVPPAR